MVVKHMFWNLLRACFTNTDLACFVGPIGAARSLESLQKNGITHVLNASPVIPCFHKRHLRYKKVLVYDDPDDDISRHFDESSRFINKVQPCTACDRAAVTGLNNHVVICDLQARKKGGVLVHCFAGFVHRIV